MYKNLHSKDSFVGIRMATAAVRFHHPSLVQSDTPASKPKIKIINEGFLLP